MIFNPLRIYDVLPQISIKQGEFTEVVEEQKILGNMNFHGNYFIDVNYLVMHKNVYIFCKVLKM